MDVVLADADVRALDGEPDLDEALQELIPMAARATG